MKTFTLILALLLLSSSPLILYSQKKTKLSPEEIEKYEKQVAGLVDYFESTLNFLGDPKSVAKEKEIVFNESYLKMFVSDKVQIEDDLDENREVPLYKNVQAYLKDIGFFFRHVKFEFVVADITHYENDKGLHYFKVTFNRSLNGMPVTGDSVSTRKVRYLEVNLDVDNNDLKIASVYTTKLNEAEEARAWWNNLPVAWKSVLGKNVFVLDSVELSNLMYYDAQQIIVLQKGYQPDLPQDTTAKFGIDIPEEKNRETGKVLPCDTILCNTESLYAGLKGVLRQQEINLAGNHEIISLSPLTELTELRVIDCSNTLVTDLVPIRNLNHLEVINFSETPVDDISPLHYTTTLRELNCSYTLIKDLTPIDGLVNLESLKCEGIKLTSLDFASQMKKLKLLDCSNTRIYNLSPVEAMATIESLDISGTNVVNLDVVKMLTHLTYLNCEHTTISSLVPHADLINLEILRISNTEVRSLVPLDGLPALKRIYCDNTLIEKQEAIQFMRDHPECLVIFESEDLFLSWNELEEPWKEIVRKSGQISEPPTREELHQVLTTGKLNVSGNTDITTLNPVKRLFNLTLLDVSSTKIADFTPIAEAVELEELNVSNTAIASVDFMSKLSRLHILNIENTKVSSLTPLEKLSSLKFIYADSTGIDDAIAFNFKKKIPGCIVIYKTKELETWWKNLPASWKSLFTEQYAVHSSPTTEQLHSLLFLDSLSVTDNLKIDDLTPVSIMKGLKSINLNRTMVISLQPLELLSDMESVTINQSPVNDLISLTGLTRLISLNIENTPLESLEPIASLFELKSLNASGSQLKTITPLQGLIKLEEVRLNNTLIKSLKPLLELPSLKTLECYNTKLTTKVVDKFKEAKPDCKVVYY